MFTRLRTILREGYPGPVRTATYPFGLPTLTEDEQADVDKDTGLIAKQMCLLWPMRDEGFAQPA